MTEYIVETNYKDGETTVYVEKDMGITTDNPALLGELVRCQNCKWFYRSEPEDDTCVCTHYCDSLTKQTLSQNENGYCAWGERRTHEV